MNSFANIYIDKVFDTLGVQLYDRRTTTEILESLPSDEALAAKLNPYSLYSRIRSREYTGRYYAPTLKSAAIKLYITLYFYVNSKGETEEIGYDEMADLIGVDKKTIRASLDALQNKGFIEWMGNSRYSFFAWIKNYQEMYDQNRRPSVGYITLNKEILNKILSLKGINALRCTISVLFRTLRNQFKSVSKVPATELDIKTLSWNLPRYVKPGIIRESLSQAKEIFRISEGRFGKYIFLLEKEYRASEIKKQIRIKAKENIRDLITKVDQMAAAANNAISNKDELPDGWGYGMTEVPDMYELRDAYERNGEGRKGIPILEFNSDQRNDLVTLCTEYSIELVTNGILNFYRNYILKGVQLINPIGAIREIIREMITLNSPEVEMA